MNILRRRIGAIAFENDWRQSGGGSPVIRRLTGSLRFDTLKLSEMIPS
jgi:hypothetical protein